MEEQKLNLTDEQKKQEGLHDGKIINAHVHQDVCYMIASIKLGTLPDVSEFETQPLGSEIWWWTPHGDAVGNSV